MEYKFHVTGMTCSHCERSVQEAVLELDDSAQVRIDRAQNLVTVDSTQPAQRIAQAITEEAGYQTTVLPN
jgi:copper chaperone